MGRRTWLFFFVILPSVMITSFYILSPELATDRFVEFIRDILEPLTMSQQFNDNAHLTAPCEVDGPCP